MKLCRGNSGAEETEDGEGERRISDHFAAWNQHTAQGTASQHRDRQGLYGSCVMLMSAAAVLNGVYTSALSDGQAAICRTSCPLVGSLHTVMFRS